MLVPHTSRARSPDSSKRYVSVNGRSRGSASSVFRTAAKSSGSVLVPAMLAAVSRSRAIRRSAITRSVCSVTTQSRPLTTPRSSVTRAVGEGVVRLLWIPAPLEEQPQVFVPRRLSGVQHPLDPWPDLRPDFRPHLAGRPAERPGMLGAERHRAVGVVVEERQLGAPSHPHGEPRRQEHAHDRPQALWPGVCRTKRRRGPLLGTHEAGHLASSGEQVVSRRGGGHMCARGILPPGPACAMRAKPAMAGTSHEARRYNPFR